MTLTMSVAVDGVLSVHPWLRGKKSNLLVSQLLDEDVFSLIVADSKARGLASFSGDEPPSVRWGHNDAGGDWVQDGKVRQLAWLQCAIPETPLAGRRIPVQPALSVLDDVLSLVGVVELAAVHAIVPLAGAPDGRFDLAAMARWFDFTDPQSARTVSVALSLPADSLHRTSPLPALIQDRSIDRITVVPVAEDHELPPGLSPYGMPWLMGSGERARLALRCNLPAWSIDTASWVIEILIEAFRELGMTAPVAITVRSMLADD